MNRSVAKRYVSAMIELAQRRDKIERFYDDMTLLSDLFKKELKLFNMMSNPVLTIIRRVNIIRMLTEKVGISEEVGRLLSLLIENKRFPIFFDIVSLYKEEMDETLNRIEAVAIFPFKPSSKIIKIVTKRIEEVSGKEVKLLVEMDPDIIGGIVIKYGDTIHDGSIRLQIARMLKY